MLVKSGQLKWLAKGRSMTGDNTPDIGADHSAVEQQLTMLQPTTQSKMPHEDVTPHEAVSCT